MLGGKPFGYVWIVSQVLPLGSSYLACSTLQDVDHNLHLWIIPLTQGGTKKHVQNSKQECHGATAITNYKLMIESNWMTLEISTVSSQILVQVIPREFLLSLVEDQPPKSGTRFGFGSTNSSANVWIFMGESHVNVTLLCTTFCLGSRQATVQTFTFPLSPHNLNHHLTHPSSWVITYS